ncbi:hypothetical protein Dsin_004276 [Dipteronia sinensis]|uniref:Uncharacterized protein n=1 Tax=Dipteronia sinensis TaxID=43782 RepID=A0AAE0BAH0_9ROSI|nr:hypothetical protein Dsin_004276 [Dipteronia sinensis]
MTLFHFISIIMEDDVDESRPVTSDNRTPKKRGRPRKLEMSSKNHGMITRRNKVRESDIQKISRKGNCLRGKVSSDGKEDTQVSNSREKAWILKEEIAKVIEAGAALGVDYRSLGSMGVKIGSWSLDEEISKVIEIRVALRFDFNGDESVLVKEITRQKIEELERLNEGEREVLWEFLIISQYVFPCPWGFGGDFNMVLEPSERNDGACPPVSLRNFNSFVLKSKVVDIPLQELKCTWTNCREKASWARLDWFLISPIILSWFPKLIQLGLSSSLSDHNAILIGAPCVDWGPILFKFYNGLLEEKPLIENARKAWLACKGGLLLCGKKKVPSSPICGLPSGWRNGNRGKNRGLNGFMKGIRTLDIFIILPMRGGGQISLVIYTLMVVDYFKNHFRMEQWCIPNIENLHFKQLTDQERDLLEVCFGKEEV